MTKSYNFGFASKCSRKDVVPSDRQVSFNIASDRECPSACAATSIVRKRPTAGNTALFCSAGISNGSGLATSISVGINMLSGQPVWSPSEPWWQGALRGNITPTQRIGSQETNLQWQMASSSKSEVWSRLPALESRQRNPPHAFAMCARTRNPDCNRRNARALFQAEARAEAQAWSEDVMDRTHEVELVGTAAQS